MRTLLIVEDQDIIRLGLEKMVRNTAIVFDQILLADSGETALKIMEAHPTSIVLVDIHLKKMTGLDFIRKAKKMFVHEVRFIIVSGYSDFSYAQEGIRLGILDYLVKPVRKEALEQTLQKTCASLEEATQLHSEDSVDHHLIRRAIQYINQNHSEDLSMTVLSNELNISYNYFSNLFKQVTGTTFSKYLLNVRIENAKNQLLQTTMRISDIANNVGFHDEKYFSRSFKEVVHMTPNEYRTTNK